MLLSLERFMNLNVGIHCAFFFVIYFLCIQAVELPIFLNDTRLLSTQVKAPAQARQMVCLSFCSVRTANLPIQCSFWWWLVVLFLLIYSPLVFTEKNIHFLMVRAASVILCY